MFLNMLISWLFFVLAVVLSTAHFYLKDKRKNIRSKIKCQKIKVLENITIVYSIPLMITSVLYAINVKLAQDIIMLIFTMGIILLITYLLNAEQKIYKR